MVCKEISASGKVTEHVMLSRTIDLLDWNSLINNTTKISNLLMVPNLEVSQKPESANWVERSLLGNWGHFKHKNTPLNLKTCPTLHLTTLLKMLPEVRQYLCRWL